MPTGGTRAHASHFARQQAGTCTYLVAWRDDVPVGVVVIRWDGTLPPEVQAACPDCVEIRNLGVDPEYQGQGIGTALIYAGEERIRARGRAFVGLGVAGDNPRAARLYAALGYRDSGIRDVSRYMYADDEGANSEIVEHNSFFVKALDPQPRR